MSPNQDSLSIYRELADRYDRYGQFSMRDRFLMLAADCAYRTGQTELAEELRQRLLRQSRHHMLRPYSSFAEALEAADVQTYLGDLRANYPPETAAQLLASMKGPKAASTPAPAPAPVEQTRPLDWAPGPAPASIPQTAPLVDPYKPTSGTNQPAWQPVRPYRLLDEPPDVPDTTATAKPMAQPLPGRKVPPPPAEPAPVLRPTAAIPLAAPAPAAPPPPRPAPAPPVSPARRPAAHAPATATTADSTWLAAVLVALAALAGVALGAFTLARPFLPAEWLH